MYNKLLTIRIHQQVNKFTNILIIILIIYCKKIKGQNKHILSMTIILVHIITANGDMNKKKKNI